MLERPAVRRVLEREQNILLKRHSGAAIAGGAGKAVWFGSSLSRPSDPRKSARCCAGASAAPAPCRRAADVEPADVPALLPHLQLVDIVDGRFRYRLVGTALVTPSGATIPANIPTRCSRTPAALHLPGFTAVREARRPMFLRSRYLTNRDVELFADRLYLPLSQDGREVDMILGALSFDFGTAEPVAGACAG